MSFHVQEFVNEIAQGQFRALIEAAAAMGMADIDASFGRMK